MERRTKRHHSSSSIDIGIGRGRSPPGAHLRRANMMISGSSGNKRKGRASLASVSSRMRTPGVMKCAKRSKASAATLIAVWLIATLSSPPSLHPSGHLLVMVLAADDERVAAAADAGTCDGHGEVEDASCKIAASAASGEKDGEEDEEGHESDEVQEVGYDPEEYAGDEYDADEAMSWSGARATDPDDLFSAPGDNYRPPPYSDVWEMSDFIVPPLRPGELKMLRWNDDWFEDKHFVQNYAARIGLPKHALAVLRKYASDLGMLEEMYRTHYDDPLEPDEGRFYVTPAVHSGGHPLKWYIQRPGSHYASDLHWFGCADERTHESFIRALAEAGIDMLLDAVAEEYELDSLAIQGVGFLAATHADEDGFIHWDWSKTGGKAFNILIPLEQVPGSGPELYVADSTWGDDESEDDNVGEIKLHPNYGLLLGDDSNHGTHQCDHRPSGKIRASVTIYFADLTRHNLDVVSADPTAVFPLQHSVQWLWTQRGRHWSSDGASLVNDVGRRSFSPVDKWSKEVCEGKRDQGMCEVSNPHETRTNCAVTCKVFLTDDEYQLGVARTEVFY